VDADLRNRAIAPILDSLPPPNFWKQGEILQGMKDRRGYALRGAGIMRADEVGNVRAISSRFAAPRGRDIAPRGAQAQLAGCRKCAAATLCRMVQRRATVDEDRHYSCVSHYDVAASTTPHTPTAETAIACMPCYAVGWSSFAEPWAPLRQLPCRSISGLAFFRYP
jgi:hypothetical protein